MCWQGFGESIGDHYMKLFKRKQKTEETETSEQTVLDPSTHVQPITIHTDYGNINATVTSKVEVHSNYVRVDDRINKYYSDDNTYISKTGQQCVAIEESLINRVEDFNKSICPCCRKEIKLPKQKTTCKNCNNKIFIVQGFIKQGDMVLTEDEYNLLKIMRDKFYHEKSQHNLT